MPKDRAYHKQRARLKVIGAVCKSEDAAIELCKWRDGRYFYKLKRGRTAFCGCCTGTLDRDFWIVVFDEPTDLCHRVARLVSGDKPKLIREGDWKVTPEPMPYRGGWKRPE